MKKTIIIIIIISTFLVFLSQDIYFFQNAKADSGKVTFYVGGNGAGNYSSVQDALDNATEGDTIYVFNGTYYEHLNIQKTINLIGENRNNTFIDGGGTGDVVFVSADHTKIEDFTIRNSGDDKLYDQGMQINSDHNQILNNNLLSNQLAIELNSSSNNIIKSNEIDSNNRGINIIENSNNNLICKNVITSHDFDAIYSHNSSYNNISNNILRDNNIGIYFYNNNTNNKILKNEILNCEDWAIYFRFNENNNKISENNIKSNNVKAYTILLINSSDNYIDKNIIYSGGAVTFQSYSCSNSLINNDLDSINDFALVITDLCNNNLIMDNSVSSEGCAFVLNTSKGNKIEGNKLYDSDHGMDIYSSTNNLITSNNITLNRNGLYLLEIEYNTISNNSFRFNREYGIISNACYYNTFFHNNFIKNKYHAIEGGDNLWYNETLKEGNYWDDYNGSDKNGDGVGDESYFFNNDAVDPYPLIKPYDGPINKIKSDGVNEIYDFLMLMAVIAILLSMAYFFYVFIRRRIELNKEKKEDSRDDFENDNENLRKF